MTALVDVNLLVYAMRREVEHHHEALTVLTEAFVGEEAVGVLDETLAAVVRIGTHPRIWSTPLSAPQVLEFCDRVRSAPAAVRMRADDMCWSHFRHLSTSMDLRGNDVPDAWLASVAMVHQARLMTFDAGFRRFPGLEVQLLGSWGGGERAAYPVGDRG
ncbi:MAG TPA: TA system VapC family ribonuclease toxin [Dermatophilaceae bacterium]|nr:TA system VapC family ribonuclease toxin [Dermatophilaceae bacterium]